MKRKQLKFISLLLTMVMIVCAVPFTVSANEDTTPILTDTMYAPD